MFVPEKVSVRIITAVFFLIGVCFVSCSKETENNAVARDSFTVSTLFEEDIEIPVLPLSPRGRTARIQELEFIHGNLSIPSPGETVRYPSDFLLGPLLGREDGTEGFEYTESLLQDLIAAVKRKEGQDFVAHSSRPEAAKMQTAVQAMEDLDIRFFRIASGHQDSDSDYSYMVRFIGSEKFISGSVYLRNNGDGWTLDEIQLEPAADLNDEQGISNFDPFVYTKFL